MAQENVAEKAEKVIRNLATRTNQKTHKDEILLTTNQIRKFLTAVNLLANKVDIYKASNPLATKLSEELAMEVQYLQVKLVYQIGREKAEKNGRFGPVEEFAKKANLTNEIKGIGDDLQAFEMFNRYIEALVAYHKFLGGK